METAAPSSSSHSGESRAAPWGIQSQGGVEEEGKNRQDNSLSENQNKRQIKREENEEEEEEEVVEVNTGKSSRESFIHGLNMAIECLYLVVEGPPPKKF